VIFSFFHNSTHVTAATRESTSSLHKWFSPTSCVLLVAAEVGLSACAPTPRRNPARAAASNAQQSTRRNDTAFAAMQARGADARAMGVDQQTSIHRFDALADGGQIELQRSVDDSAGVAQIRRHLHAIASAFSAGDFSTPAFVHMQTIPGAREMAARRSSIAYVVSDLPRGGQVRMITRDTVALRAIHEFVAFQRREHHSGGDSTMSHMQMK
jgi:hypothetical protein